MGVSEVSLVKEYYFQDLSAKSKRDSRTNMAPEEAARTSLQVNLYSEGQNERTEGRV
jgi:hypothetical protein